MFDCKRIVNVTRKETLAMQLSKDKTNTYFHVQECTSLAAETAVQLPTSAARNHHVRWRNETRMFDFYHCWQQLRGLSEQTGLVEELTGSANSH